MSLVSTLFNCNSFLYYFRAGGQGDSRKRISCPAGSSSHQHSLQGLGNDKLLYRSNVLRGGIDVFL